MTGQTFSANAFCPEGPVNARSIPPPGVDCATDMMGADSGWTAPATRPILNGMREVPGAADAEWVQRMRALARQDAEEMVPRPDFPVFGVSAPLLEPAALAAYEQVNGSWAAVTLAYGVWDAVTGPYVTVK